MRVTTAIWPNLHVAQLVSNGEGSWQAIVLNYGAGTRLANGPQLRQSQCATTFLSFISTDLISVEKEKALKNSYSNSPLLTLGTHLVINMAVS